MQNSIPGLLSETKKNVFDKLGFELKNVSKEAESDEYSAHTFELDDRKIIFRNAKTTPKKTGQFVTCWKRNAIGITQPFEFSDRFDFLIVHAHFKNRHGQFVFPKSALLKQGIISGNSKEGKRGFRIYPVWDEPANSQAQKTQKWQLGYFLETTHGIDPDFAKKLYC